MRKRRDDAYTIVAIPDVHTPAHDTRAIAAVCKWMRTRRIDALVQVGDLLDMESIGRFVKESPKKLAEGSVIEEFAIARKVMTGMVSAARHQNKDCEYWQLEGNHENRLKRMVDQYPMLAGMFDVPAHLGLEELRGKYVCADSEGEVLRFEQRRDGIVPCVFRQTDIRTEIYHGASFVHGWAHNMHSSKSSAEMAPWPGPIVFGHVHTRAVYTANKWGPDKPYGVTIGWIGLPMPAYAAPKPTRWEQAFGVISLSRSTPGLHDAFALRIHNGALIGPDGIEYWGDK